jgi:Na+-driven multidrug efflux pump
MIQGIILAPLWSGYTDAYAKGDMLWIKKVLKKMNLLMLPFVIAVICLIFFSKKIISIWVGSSVEVPYSLIICMGVYVIISIWSNIYAYCVNGMGKIDIQMITAIIAGIINIPLSIYFAKECFLGVSGVALGTICSLAIFAVVGPIQTYYMLGKKKYGKIQS